MYCTPVATTELCEFSCQLYINRQLIKIVTNQIRVSGNCAINIYSDILSLLVVVIFITIHPPLINTALCFPSFIISIYNSTIFKFGFDLNNTSFVSIESLILIMFVSGFRNCQTFSKFAKFKNSIARPSIPTVDFTVRFL